MTLFAVVFIGIGIFAMTFTAIQLWQNNLRTERAIEDLENYANERG